MSDEALVALVLFALGGVGWLTHMSYRIGRIYTLLRVQVGAHRTVLRVHGRRLDALEARGSNPRPAAS